MTNQAHEQVDLIYDHEATALFANARQLHLFACALENQLGSTRYTGRLTLAALQALLHIATAAVATDDRGRKRHLQRVLESLRRCRTMLVSLTDRGILDNAACTLATNFARLAESAVAHFDVDLQNYKSEIKWERASSEPLDKATTKPSTVDVSEPASPTTIDPRADLEAPTIVRDDRSPSHLDSTTTDETNMAPKPPTERIVRRTPAKGLRKRNRKRRSRR